MVGEKAGECRNPRITVLPLGHGELHSYPLQLWTLGMCHRMNSSVESGYF